jgi:hypothetical protein
MTLGTLAPCLGGSRWGKRGNRHSVSQSAGQLTALIKTRLKRTQYRPGLLGGFLAKPGSTSHCRNPQH